MINFLPIYNKISLLVIDNLTKSLTRNKRKLCFNYYVNCYCIIIGVVAGVSGTHPTGKQQAFRKKEIILDDRQVAPLKTLKVVKKKKRKKLKRK